MENLIIEEDNFVYESLQSKDWRLRLSLWYKHR